MATHTGQCLCGAVRFAFDDPVKFCAHCHCSLCRRAHGAPVVTWTGVVLSQFRLDDSQASLRRYASSVDAIREFCGQCGTSLFFHSTRWPGEVHIASACIDGELSQQPSAHVFYSDRCSWHGIHDNLPKYGGATGLQRLDEDAS